MPCRLSIAWRRPGSALLLQSALVPRFRHPIMERVPRRDSQHTSWRLVERWLPTSRTSASRSTPSAGEPLSRAKSEIYKSIQMVVATSSSTQPTGHSAAICHSTASSNPRTAGALEQFEAFARSVRDVLSQRWVLTKEAYRREDPTWTSPDHTGHGGAWRFRIPLDRAGRILWLGTGRTRQQCSCAFAKAIARSLERAFARSMRRCWPTKRRSASEERTEMAFACCGFPGRVNAMRIGGRTWHDS
jgi:hypothetical protein